MEVVETPGDVGRAPSGWTVGQIPELRIGQVDGAEPYNFFTIEGVAQSANGGILVTDRSGELRYFDPNGVFLYRTGGQGQGPGEFVSPEILHPSGDTLWMFDGRVSRLIAMSADGHVELGRELVPNELGTVKGVLDGQAITYRNVDGMMMSQDGTFNRSVVVEVLVTFVRGMASPSRRSRRVARFEGTAGMFSYTNPQSPGMRIADALPFRMRPSVAVGKEAFYVTPGEEPEIWEYGPIGVLPRRVFRLSEAPRTLTRAEYNAAVDRRFPDGPAYTLDAYRGLPVPPSIPAFGSLLVDTIGWVWAEVYQFDPRSPTTWVVFDLDGRARGVVETPEGLRVRQIGEDFILGTRRDELRVEYVERYALTRR